MIETIIVSITLIAASIIWIKMYLIPSQENTELRQHFNDYKAQMAGKIKDLELKLEQIENTTKKIEEIQSKLNSISLKVGFQPQTTNHFKRDDPRF